MRPETTFRIDEVHYDFFVMPFGLANVPSIFKKVLC